MAKLLLTFFICVQALTFTACKVRQSAEKPEGALEALVIKSDLSGCDWLIKTEDGQVLEPDYLDEKFKKDKLEVWITFRNEKGKMSVCMSGLPVIISFIDFR